MNPEVLPTALSQDLVKVSVLTASLTKGALQLRKTSLPPEQSPGVLCSPPAPGCCPSALSDLDLLI